ncbi:signal recognition particle-docking protein FtsY [Candidatus Bathyarchaeota archaeon RBG_13_38_9]|nr:MAG: signal recognition particle-docking protein FtsY [Candidatus Bathyarchaeota archaeon RBG_13_38_9]
MFEKLKSGLENFFDKISKTELNEKSIDSLIEDLKLILIQNDVAFTVAENICDQLREQLNALEVKRFGDHLTEAKTILRDILQKTLVDNGKENLFDIIKRKQEKKEPAIIVFIGINGTGKTTTIAKLAHLLIKKGFTTILACSDTYRTGSIEQIEEHARRLGVKTIKHSYGSDAAAVAYDTINYAKAHGTDSVLIDTAGRMQTNRNLIDEMKKIIRIAKPDLTLLVIDALTGNDAAEQAAIFSKAVSVDGIILTKLDADAKGGSAISVSSITGKQVLFMGIGQEYDDLLPFDPNFILNRILGE